MALFYSLVFTRTENPLKTLTEALFRMVILFFEKSFRKFDALAPENIFPQLFLNRILRESDWLAKLTFKFLKNK